MGMGEIEGNRGMHSRVPHDEGLACLCASQGDQTRVDSKVSAQDCSETSVSQYVVPPILFANQSGCPVALFFIQPSEATIQTQWRTIEFHPPEMDRIRVKADQVLPFWVDEMVDRLE